MARTDKFPPSVKKRVAERAAYVCSRPECRVGTIGPHPDPNKSLGTGVAAHICAAAPGGPRYDSTQSERERKGIENAIWLCHNCSDLVDKAPIQFTAEMLRGWKEQHEQAIRKSGGIARFPNVQLETKRGLTLASGVRSSVTAADVARYREHELSISNGTGRVLYHLTFRIQFPEPVASHQIVEVPVGSQVRCEPDEMKFVANATGSGSVKIIGGFQSWVDWVCEIDRLPSAKRLTVRFISGPNGDR